MGNTDYLKGITCPRCGHTEDFHMQVEVNVRANDDGVMETPRVSHRAQYYPSSWLSCPECGKAGQVKDFQKE